MPDFITKWWYFYCNNCRADWGTEATYNWLGFEHSPHSKCRRCGDSGKYVRSQKSMSYRSS
jgi:hypothetical protein